MCSRLSFFQVMTIYEDDLGTPVADVNFFAIQGVPAKKRIFICV